MAGHIRRINNIHQPEYRSCSPGIVLIGIDGKPDRGVKVEHIGVRMEYIDTRQRERLKTLGRKEGKEKR